jgi:hypothetical protein
LIAAKAKGEGEELSSKPLMLIDENEVPHSFCIGKPVHVDFFRAKLNDYQIIANRSQRRLKSG